jgi:hypothetical protein
MHASGCLTSSIHRAAARKQRAFGKEHDTHTERACGQSVKQWTGRPGSLFNVACTPVGFILENAVQRAAAKQRKGRKGKTWKSAVTQWGRRIARETR